MSAPFAVMALITSLALFGAWGLLRHWRHLMETQLRIDRCVGLAAQDFRAKLVRIEELNDLIEKARAAAALAALIPGGEEADAAAIGAMAIAQDAELGMWTLKRAAWLLKRGCDSKFADHSHTLPAFEYFRPPPDPLGPQPLVWPGGMPSVFYIQIESGSRHSAAMIGESNETIETLAIAQNSKWKLKWCRSPGYFGAGPT